MAQTNKASAFEFSIPLDLSVSASSSAYGAPIYTGGVSFGSDSNFVSWLALAGVGVLLFLKFKT